MLTSAEMHIHSKNFKSLLNFVSNALSKKAFVSMNVILMNKKGFSHSRFMNEEKCRGSYDENIKKISFYSPHNRFSAFYVNS